MRDKHSEKKARKSAPKKHFYNRPLPLLIIFAMTFGLTGSLHNIVPPDSSLSASYESPEEMIVEPVPQPRSITISAVGDCTLGCDTRYASNSVAKTFFDVAKTKDASYFLANVAPTLRGADLTFANLEGVLTADVTRLTQEPKPEQGNKAYWFYGPPNYVDILKLGGIDVVTVANNHSHDYKDEGYEETAAILTEAGIPFTGYDEPVVITRNDIRVGSIGLNLLGKNERGVDIEAFLDNAGAQIGNLRANCDLLVVQIHWGDEGVRMPNLRQVNVGHLLIDMGADIVLGHHSHVAQPTEFYKGRYIVYSLGNFCFGGNQTVSSDTKLTGIWQLEATVDGEGRLSLAAPKVIPCSVNSDVNSVANDYQPTPLTDSVPAQSAVERLAVLSTEELQKRMGLVFPENPYHYAPLTDKSAGNMVEALQYVPGLKKDIRYYSDRNFLQGSFYDSDKVYLRKSTAEKLKGVVAELKEYGLALLIWDAYRPQEAQRKMWEAVPDARYIANPDTGYSRHTYGTAVDVTLVDAYGAEVVMPTDFDNFSVLANHDLSNIESEDARNNLQVLRRVMENNGFEIYYNEWWHYEDVDSGKYGPVLDLLKVLEKPGI
ncbi:MAG: CapA family protein [Peptococcaceae bacterium]|nr:CapA family protein [Peptococcaceae bacterium]